MVIELNECGELEEMLEGFSQDKVGKFKLRTNY